MVNRGSMAALTCELALLIDKQAIVEAIYRYARAIDRLDRGLLQDLCDPDTRFMVDDYVMVVDEFWAMFCGMTAAMAATHHQIGNILVDVDGEHARSEAYFTGYLRMARSSNDEDWWVGGRYLHNWKRCDGGWKLLSQRLIQEWENAKAPVVGGRFQPSEARRGRRDASDPSYGCV